METNHLVAKSLAEALEPQMRGGQPSFGRATRSYASEFWGFETFGEAKLEGLLDAADAFLSDVASSKRPRWLSLLGPTGAGKTHLSKRIYGEASVRLRFYQHECGATLTRNVLWLDWRKFSDRLKNGDFGAVDDVCDAWFVAIDDIGAEYDPNKMVASKLDRILNDRLGKWTLITSNLYLAEISESLDPRIASRMRRAGGVVVETTAKDFTLR